MLNEDQQKLTDKLLEFVQLPGKVFVIHGKAGTGKTYTIKKFFKDNKLNVVFSAPTHAATKNLAEPGIESKTLHSLLGLQLDLELSNFDSTKPSFTMKDVKPINNFEYVVVDEYSMIPNKLKKFLVNETVPKIIYVGDLSQLPPVEEDDIEYELYPDFELTRNMRSKSELISRVTEDIRMNRFNPKQYPELFKTVSEIDFSDVIVLSYTNKRVAEFNKYLKDKLNPSDTELSVGDKIIFYDSVMTSDYEIKNGSSYVITGYDAAGHTITFKDSSEEFKMEYVGQDGLEEYKKVCASKINYINSLPANMNKGKYWRSYYNWRHSKLLFKDIYSGKKYIAKKHFDLAYAITIHKSQGQTFKNVVVDYKSITGDNAQELLYVAASRASDSLIFLI